jgi:GNAT superfamily N-acetyltransferase
MASLAAPLDRAVRLETRSGLALDVRPATPLDAPALVAMFDAVSPEDRRFRFLSASERITAEQVALLADVDHWRAESFLASTEDGALVATGMLACDAEMETAEVAISICANRKGQGIGWTLLAFLTGQAMLRGVKRVISIESRDNHQAIALEREMGFVARPIEGDPSVMLLEARF